MRLASLFSESPKPRLLNRYLSYQAQIKSHLDTAGYTTEAAQVQTDKNAANVLITENIKNIANAKGFINSNITKQQLIP